eukprot:4093888-Amphidinium_carterae.1
MPQSVLGKHFSKIGVAKTGIDEVSIQHLKEKLKINAINSSTVEMDVRTPKSRRRMGDDSAGVSSQDTPERSEIQTCCTCEATVGLRQCQVGECRHMSCMRHRYWVARDQPDHSEAEEEERVIEEEIRSQDFSGMINFTGRDVDSFHLVDQDSSRSLSSEESAVQGRDLSQPEVIRVQVRAHQRTLQDGRIVNVRSHSRRKGKGRSVTLSPERVSQHKGGFKRKGKGKSSKQGKRIIRLISAVSSENEQSDQMIIQ